MNDRMGALRPSRVRQAVVTACGAVFLAGCVAPPPPRWTPPAGVPGGATAPPASPTPQSVALTVDGYKRDVARHIYRMHPEALFDGAPPPVLRSVVVLAIRVDPAGYPVQVAVVRSNGYQELNAIAVASVRSAAPLPVPNRIVMRNGAAEFFETWLFRDDGRFQIRSLAEAQEASDD